MNRKLVTAGLVIGAVAMSSAGASGPVISYGGAFPGRSASAQSMPITKAVWYVAARAYFVLLEKFLSACKAVFTYQRRHGDLDPFFTRSFVARRHAGRSYTTPSLRAHHARS